MADLKTNISAGVGAIITTLVLLTILRTVRRTPVEVDGKRVLEYDRPMKIVAAVIGACGFGLCADALLAPTRDHTTAVAVVGFLLLTLSLCLEFFGVRVEFDASSIRTRSPWRPDREIPWSAVERVWFSQAMQWYIVRTNGFGRVRLHVYLNGVESLLREIEARGVPIVR
jgi:hypothetical protein